ncbi:hypothetical protein [Streptomyces oceani]|uniref:hypothetical protein n=1 Tax=Streptomyces oceani TaxID=1075402 RepID=UPI0009A0F130|nr:hypothetical protein [Streptomyces oceani]
MPSPPGVPRSASPPPRSAHRSRLALRTGARWLLRPLLAAARGLGPLTTTARSHWSRVPKERRGVVVCLLATVLLLVGLAPYGPAVAGLTVALAAAWQGRERNPPPPEEGPGAEEEARLHAVYEALVPHFSLPEDPHPHPLYAHEGTWQGPFEAYEFDETGRLTALTLRYPAHFRDGDARERLGVERTLGAKMGRAREHRLDWDEERNRLRLSVLPALPGSVRAQRFVTSPGETVLGFTDADSVQRTIPVRQVDREHDLPPVMWRGGPRSTEPHLLALGGPGTGVSTLLRSVTLQALRAADVLLVDGGGAGEFACLAGRAGMLAVESSVTGALTALEWAGQETERRLLSANRARQAGMPVPEDVRRPLWLVVDRPAVLSQLARTEGRRDPLELLETPLRHGRAARVTVAVGEQFQEADALSEPVRAHTRARVVLGALTREQVTTVLGEAPPTTPVPHPPAGRGYARLGCGPVLRLQVPATPDPQDEATAEGERQAVVALLPERNGAGAGTASGASTPTSTTSTRPTQAEVTGAAETPERVRTTAAGALATGTTRTAG